MRIASTKGHSHRGARPQVLVAATDLHRVGEVPHLDEDTIDQEEKSLIHIDAGPTADQDLRHRVVALDHPLTHDLSLAHLHLGGTTAVVTARLVVEAVDVDAVDL